MHFRRLTGRKDWCEPTTAIVPLSRDRWLHLERMPDAMEYFGLENLCVDMWNPMTCGWQCWDADYGCTIVEGEKYMLLRLPCVAVRDVWEEIRLCTRAADDVLFDARVRDFTDQYREAVNVQ